MSHLSCLCFIFCSITCIFYFLLEVFIVTLGESIYLIFSPDLLPLRDTLGHLPCPSAHAQCHIQLFINILSSLKFEPFQISMKPNLFSLFN